MKLIIIRHAQTEGNEKGIIQGTNDSDLTELGRKQAERLAIRLSKMKIDFIYSSDLGRCKRTIAPLLKMKKISIEYVKELRERDYGIFNNKPNVEYVEWVKSNGGFSISLKAPEGESHMDVIERTGKFLKKILKSEEGKTILIVAHSGSKRAILMNLLDRRDQDYINETREFSKNTAVTIINIKENGKHHIESFYSLEHLEDL